MAKYKGYRVESNRWDLWDYSAPASYFLTICTHNRLHIFGNVIDKQMQLSVSGEIAANEFLKIPEYHKRITLDEWVVMPNHAHCVITLHGEDYDNGFTNTENATTVEQSDTIQSLKWQWNDPSEPTEKTQEEIIAYQRLRRNMLIPKIMSKFKQQISKQINLINNTIGLTNWQADYHDHVIRSNTSYWYIRNYIVNNPAKWDEDKFNTRE
jgi:putative transposase